MLMRLGMKPRTLAIGLGAGLLMVAAIAFGALFALSPSLRPWTLDPANPQVTLEDVEREVIRRYPVDDVLPATLAAMIAKGDVTLLDVRTKEEFELGHLAGAIRVEPGSSAEEILRQHQAQLKGRPVVFYCAVGVRSSQVLMQTLRELAPHNDGRLYNLRGGVFRWSAEGRPLVSGDKPGKAHPYDKDWGQLLSRTVPGL
jgi:rhodanese-related sulfurtransferase